jgi:hypothetical protein
MRVDSWELVRIGSPRVMAGLVPAIRRGTRLVAMAGTTTGSSPVAMAYPATTRLRTAPSMFTDMK